MSIGLSLINAAIAQGSRVAFRQIDPSLFMPEERPALEFVTRHMDAHGALPTLQVLAENGIMLTPTAGNLSYYLERLRGRAIHNAATEQMLPLSDALRARDTEGVINIVNGLADRLRYVRGTSGIVNFEDALAQVWTDYETASSTVGMRGITTGFRPLDYVTNGLRNGDVSTLVARPGIGKSFTILKMAIAAWLAGHSVAFVSMEMTALETATRLMAMATGLNPERIARGRLGTEAEGEARAFTATVPDMPPFNFLIGDLDKSVSDVDAMIQEFDPDIVYVDASYLLKPMSKLERKRTMKRWENLTDVAEEIRGLSLRANKHIVQTVQFNRTSSDDVEMNLDQIGGSDAIGQVSALAVGIRLGAAPNERSQRRYKVMKNRHGIDWLEFSTSFGFNPFRMDVLDSNVRTEEDENITDEPPEDGDGNNGVDPVVAEFQE